MPHTYNKKIILLTIPTLFLTVGFLFFICSSPAFAQPLKLQIHVDSLAEISQDQVGKGLGITVYLAAIYRWLTGALSMVAVLFIMIGGLIWLTAAGSSKNVTLAKKLIFDSLGGLTIVLGSYMFLDTINPALVGQKSILSRVSQSESDWDTFVSSGTPKKSADTPDFIAAETDDTFTVASLGNNDVYSDAGGGVSDDDVAEPGKPGPDDFVSEPNPCNQTGSLDLFTFFIGTPVYGSSETPCIITMRKFGLPQATDLTYPKDRSKNDMIWDLKNGGVEKGIKEAALALTKAHPEGHYDYEGLIGMWAAHEMQFNPYGSACGKDNAFKLNHDCAWGHDNYQVGLGVHTEQIAYLKEALMKVRGGTDGHVIRAVAQNVIARSGKGALGESKKETHASLNPAFISITDFDTITSADTLIQKAKAGDAKSKREVVILMRDPGISAYLIGMHLTHDFGSPSNLGNVMNGWKPENSYTPQKMANLFAGYYDLIK